MKIINVLIIVTVFVVIVNLISWKIISRSDRDNIEDFYMEKTGEISKINTTVKDFATNYSYRHGSNLTRIREKLLEAFETKKVVSTHVEDFYIVKNGRLGNNIIQLSNAIYYCEILGCSRIIIPDSFWFIKSPIFYKKFNMTIGKRKDFGYPEGQEDYNRSSSYAAAKIYWWVKGFPAPDRSAVFKDEFMKNLPNVRIDEDALYIHIRGGDIFRKSPLPNEYYGQPPLCYYKSIIERWGFKKIYVIAEDKKNPCVDGLLNSEHNVIHLHTTLEEDVAYIIKANNLAMSIGSFVTSLVRFSEKKKTFFCYRLKWAMPMDYYSNTPTKEYEKVILSGNWKNTREQREIMMNATCDPKWEYVKVLKSKILLG